MVRHKKDIPTRRHYSKDLKRRVIYQAFTLQKKTTKIAKSLDIDLRVVQRVLQTWREIGEVCQDRARLGRAPIMSPGSIEVSEYVCILLYTL